MADEERGQREALSWYARDEVCRTLAADLGRRVDALEERTDGLGVRVDGLAASEANRKRRGDDITGVGKVLALLASIGGAVLAYLSYARH